MFQDKFFLIFFSISFHYITDHSQRACYIIDPTVGSLVLLNIAQLESSSDSTCHETKIICVFLKKIFNINQQFKKKNKKKK
jgi:hypothetical protein